MNNINVGNTNFFKNYIAPGILKESLCRRMEWLDGKSARKEVWF